MSMTHEEWCKKQSEEYRMCGYSNCHECEAIWKEGYTEGVKSVSKPIVLPDNCDMCILEDGCEAAHGSEACIRNYEIAAKA